MIKPHIADVVLDLYEKNRFNLTHGDLVVIADTLHLRLSEAHELVMFAKARDTCARRLWVLCERSELLAVSLAEWVLENTPIYSPIPEGLPRQLLDLPILPRLRSQLTERLERCMATIPVLPWRHPLISQGLFGLLDLYEIPSRAAGGGL